MSRGEFMEDATLLNPAISSWVLRSLDDEAEHKISHNLLIGREAECGLALISPHISRYHAKLTRNGATLYVEDLHSANGTFVNGERIQTRRAITLGDEIAFHDRRFRVVSTDFSKEEATIIETPLGRAAFPGKQVAQMLRQSESPVVSQDEEEGTRMLNERDLARLARRAASPSQLLPEAPGQGPRLVILTAPLRGKIIPLHTPLPDHHWSIGRSEECDICLPDKTISADHARLGHSAGGWLLSTTHARNGIQVNGKPTARAFLKHNDRLRFGRLELCFKLQGAADQLPEASADEIAHRRWRLTMLIGLPMMALVLTALLILLAR
jgi:pSer/pThr/pTyr-binding forkhead associated (FHA) protein